MFISVHMCLWGGVLPQKSKICSELVGESSKPLGLEPAKENKKEGSRDQRKRYERLSVQLWLWNTKKNLFGWDELEGFKNRGEDCVPPLHPLNTSAQHCSCLLQPFPMCYQYVWPGWFLPTLRQDFSFYNSPLYNIEPGRLKAKIATQIPTDDKKSGPCLLFLQTSIN